MKKYSDIEIIIGLKADDMGAFEYLFEMFHDNLFHFTVKLIENKEEASDIVVNTFTKFYKIKNNFDTLINIKAFLFITCRNKCHDFLRFHRRQSTGKKGYGSHLLAAEDMRATERAIIRADLLAKVYLEVKNLPEKCRQVFELTYLKGMKANEIAQTMKISVSNVTSQRQRAIQYLRGVLPEEHFVSIILLLSIL